MKHWQGIKYYHDIYYLADGQGLPQIGHTN